MLSNNNADTDVGRWFDLHRLPWTEAIQKKLDDEGVGFVEDLKLLKASFVKDLFSTNKPIIKKGQRLPEIS